MHDNKFINIAKNYKVILTITHGNRFFKIESYGVNKEIENALISGFISDELVKLTMKSDSSLSHINKC